MIIIILLELITYFKDSRYIKVDGKPMFIIYRPNLFPNIKETIALWRKEAKVAGFPDIYIGCTKTMEFERLINDYGFDFVYEFQPNFSNRPQY